MSIVEAFLGGGQPRRECRHLRSLEHRKRRQLLRLRLLRRRASSEQRRVVRRRRIPAAVDQIRVDESRFGPGGLRLQGAQSFCQFRSVSRPGPRAPSPRP